MAAAPKIVNGMADTRIVEDADLIRRHRSPAGKAYLHVTFEDGSEALMTLNLAQLIGGMAHGTAIRLGYEK